MIQRFCSAVGAELRIFGPETTQEGFSCITTAVFVIAAVVQVEARRRGDVSELLWNENSVPLMWDAEGGKKDGRDVYLWLLSGYDSPISFSPAPGFDHEQLERVLVVTS